MQVNVSVQAPGELYHHLPKRSYRRGDVQVLGVLWETADFICTKCCSLVIDGYGNYVTRLQKEVKRLTETYEPKPKENKN